MENSTLDCPICQQSLLTPSTSPPPSPHFDIVSSPSAPVCTPCGHIFHKACIAEWFRFRRRQHQNDNTEGSSTRTTFRCSCPTCRKSIAYHKLIRVYLPSTSPFLAPPPSPPEPFHGEPSLSVAEHVRRFNQRTQAPAPQPEGNSTRPSPQPNSQIYNEFFTIYNAINEEDYDAQSESSSTTSPTSPASASQFACQNFDCIALQSVYQVLSKEFKILQRRLTLETEVSKMKSVVVAGLQRDLNFCRKNYSQGRLTGDFARTLGIVIISVFTAWILGCVALFIVKPF